MQGISVIICCYNSGKKLIPTLQHLALQKIIPEAGYELIIIDNNCTDNTVELAQNTWRELGDIFPMHILSQPLPGLNNARVKGIKASIYDYVVLCDDDNWLCDDYLIKVKERFDTLDDVAVAGGIGDPVFDSSPPDWFKQLKGFGYAVGDEGRETGYVESVYGAGMGIRKQVLSKILENERLMLTDRKGKSLSSGGDTEICMLVRKAGYRIFLDHELKFRHYINKERLSWRYYLDLRRSFGKARAYLDAGAGKSTANNYSLLKYAIRNIKYLFFSRFLENASAASFEQEWGRRQTLVQLRKKEQGRI